MQKYRDSPRHYRGYLKSALGVKYEVVKLPRIAILAGLALAGTAAVQLQGQSTTNSASLGDRVPLTGLAANQHGLALWNAAAGAAETARDGHSTPWTTCSTAAPYYLATRDHSTIDVGSTAGFRGAPVIEGLPEFLSALTVNGFATTDLTIGWTPQTLGDDVEGDDWLFDQTSGVETRYYTGGQMTVQLRGEPLASGPMPTTTLTTSYNVLSDCADDTVTLSTGVLLLANSATTSSAPVQAVAAALVSDLADNGLRLVSDALVSTGPTIGASGRTGAFLEAATGRLEVDAPCSCDIGIHDTDLTHDWTLMWPEAALPTNGALQLKVVAVTPALASATPGPGRITVTIFDDSAPTRGLVLDVPFPTAKGEASAMVALTIQPQTEYRFTVSHSGGSGRYYRLGMSHAALRLGQADQRYLTGRSQDWAVNAGAGETVTLELATDSPIAELTMATSVSVTLVDAADGTVVNGPTELILTPGSPQTVSGQNLGAARSLLWQVDPVGGVFRMRRTDGDGMLYVQPCPARTGPVDAGPDEPVAPEAATLSQIQTELFNPFCVVCHGGFSPSAGLDVRPGRAFNNLVNRRSSQVNLMRVLPGAPDESYLVHKLDGGPSIVGTQMPQGGPLSATQIALVRSWILAGAQND